MGLTSWLVQRITAIILAAYAFLLLWKMMLHQPMSLIVWQQLFSTALIRYATLTAIIGLVLHAWIGIWTVLTDYIKPNALRLLLQLLVMVFLFGQILWGVHILWGRG